MLAARFNFANGTDPCAIRQYGFTTSVQDAGIDIGVNDGPRAWIFNLTAEHVAAGPHRPSEIRLVAGVFKGARIQGDAAEPELCRISRCRNPDETCHQCGQEEASKHGQISDHLHCR